MLTPSVSFAIAFTRPLTDLSIYDAAIDLCQRLGIAMPLLAARNKEEEPVAPNENADTMSMASN